MNLPKVRLVAWNPAEAAERAALLAGFGYQVDAAPISPQALKALRQDPPQAVVIDLNRLPSQGRDIAMQLRGFKATRALPLLFVGGAPEKVEAIRSLLPDAFYTSWEAIAPALEQALAASPPEGGYRAGSAFAAYAGVPLVKKLGLRAGAKVGLVGAPDGFSSVLEPLPEGVKLCSEPDSPCDLVLWFARSRQELENRITGLGGMAGRDGLWILWPKRGSGVDTDLTQVVVRAAGLANGLVDYKISAVDETWSGLRFAHRKGR